jgi:hypothetical protein
MSEDFGSGMSGWYMINKIICVHACIFLCVVY